VTDKKIKTEIYSRVSGYYRPVAQWNKGKQEEFENRKALQMTKRDQA
jgi:anaerobic ribonucleoside-triphosphate reductase